MAPVRTVVLPNRLSRVGSQVTPAKKCRDSVKGMMEDLELVCVLSKLSHAVLQHYRVSKGEEITSNCGAVGS